MKPWKIIKTILILALAALVIIQFIRPDRSIPEYDIKGDFLQVTAPPAEIKNMIKAACYDCHSYETTYPWYDRIAPVSYWLNGHVKHGRGELNFSLWETYSVNKKDHKLEECAEEVKEKHMPLSSYTWSHSDARLTDQQRDQLASWFDGQRK